MFVGRAIYPTTMAASHTLNYIKLNILEKKKIGSKSLKVFLKGIIEFSGIYY
jgi:hypothetical protein